MVTARPPPPVASAQETAAGSASLGPTGVARETTRPARLTAVPRARESPQRNIHLGARVSRRRPPVVPPRCADSSRTPPGRLSADHLLALSGERRGTRPDVALSSDASWMEIPGPTTVWLSHSSRAGGSCPRAGTASDAAPGRTVRCPAHDDIPRRLTTTRGLLLSVGDGALDRVVVENTGRRRGARYAP